MSKFRSCAEDEITELKTMKEKVGTVVAISIRYYFQYTKSLIIYIGSTASRLCQCCRAFARKNEEKTCSITVSTRDKTRDCHRI